MSAPSLTSDEVRTILAAAGLDHSRLVIRNLSSTSVLIAGSPEQRQLIEHTLAEHGLSVVQYLDYDVWTRER